METSFSQVDEQTQLMHDSIINIGINEKMEEMINKSEKVSAKLNSVLKKSKFASQNNPLGQMDKKEFKDWVTKLNELGK